MVCDWANYSMEFQENDRTVKLQGIQPVPLQLQEISADSFMKWHKGNDIWALAVVQQLPPTTESTAPEIQALLKKYAGVFAKPHSLPPPRVYDHTIPLFPNTILVNSPEADQAFATLKQAMTHTPVLLLPDFNQPFIVETDACATGVGAVLMQHSRPVAFLSKALGPSHQHLSIYEK